MKFIKKYLYINVCLILILFSLSVIVRLDNLKVPMGRHHEWLTGHVLTTLSIFEKNGIANHYYSPVFTLPETAERALLSKQAFKDKNSYDYYVSYPPFSFIFPYVIFKLFHLKVSVLGIRVIGLGIHFICALLIYLIINRLFGKKMKEEIFLPSLIGYAIYLFANGNLWFHGNVYFADMLVHLFILGALLVFIKITDAPEENVKMRLSGLFILTFFGVYTEWLALFVAFYMGLFFFIKAFKNKIYFKHVSVLLSACVLAIGITVCQYSAIAGLEPLKERTVEKYVERSGMYKKHAQAGFAYGTKKAKNKFISNYESNYDCLLSYAWYASFAAAGLLLANRFERRSKIPFSHIILFGVLALSIITHHLLFYNFTTLHDFSTLKSTIFFALFIAYVIAALFNYFEARYFIFGSVFFTCVTAWFIYRSVQDYSSFNKNDPDILSQKIVGQVIGQTGKTDEVMFTNAAVTPVLEWYAQRGSIPASNLRDCRDFLKIAELQKGLFVWFEVKDPNLFIKATRVSVNGDSSEVYKKVIPLKNLRSETF